MPILITGATGTVGRHLVSQIARTGRPVRALSRDPARAALGSGVELVAGDLSEPPTLDGVFDGIEAVHFITIGGDEGEPLTTGRDLVQLAVAGGARRFSVLGGWDESSVEEALRDAGIGWTLLRPVEFMAGTLEWADPIRRLGKVRLLANWPSAVVHEADIAAVAHVALTAEGHAGQAYTITGPEALTSADRTQLIGDALGRALSFEALSEDEERERLQSLGYPEDYVEFGIELATNPPPEAGVVVPTVEQVTGHPGRPFAQWVSENINAFRS